jgi:stage II sporulation protein D
MLASGCICSVAHAQDVRVSIYSLQSPRQLTLAPQGSVEWRSCAACRAHQLSSSLSVEAFGSQLQFGTPILKSSLLNVTGSYRLQVPDQRPVELRYPLEVTASKDRLVLILSMPMEDYVAAVLAGESANFQSDEALKAMAVAVRTYAVHFRGRHQAEHFDFCDTTHCQDFHLSAVTDRHRAAAEATEGELLWSRGSTAATYYNQNCGGTAAAAHEVWPGINAGYLSVHADAYCLRSEHARWESRISKADLRSALLHAGIQVPASLRSLQVDARTASGRVRLLRVIGADGSPEMKLSASTLRFGVGRNLGWNQIKSDFYDLKDAGDEVLFSGRGSGHGVGLCQEGADAMGKQGKSYREILAFYFPGTELGISAQGLSWHRFHGEQLDLLTTDENNDSRVLSIALGELHKAETNSALQLRSHPVLKIFPTLASYRDSTGEPGWVAASTRGSIIRLQPASLLRQEGALQATLRHELLHVLVDDNTRVSLPLWFREGVALYLAEGETRATHRLLPADKMESALHNPQSREQMQEAYAAAKAAVAGLVMKYGRSEVIGWLSRGIPADALASFSAGKATQH